MFDRVIDWQKAVALICDIAKGSATLSLRTHSKTEDEGGARSSYSGWDYHQVQPHGRDDAGVPKLFTLDHLKTVLSALPAGCAQFYAYEVDGSPAYNDEAKVLIDEFSDIRVTVIKLTVGNVKICWFLVFLDQSRDTLHWKMRYHDRDRRPGSETDAAIATSDSA